MAITASSDLLIYQWRAAPLMRGMTQGMIDVVKNEVETPTNRLMRMWDIDKAEGVWLDFLGLRVGIERPLIPDPLHGRAVRLARSVPVCGVRQRAF